jgi:putative ABC transport system ATP-binding protein
MSQTTEVLYEIKGLAKSYNQKGKNVIALADVDLTIHVGDLISIQGPTGGGKSTLLQMLGGLDKPTSGSISLSGDNLENMSENELAKTRSHKVGFIFQTFNLIPTLTALENVETALVPLGISSTDRRTRSLAALESVGLADRASHLPSELSGGQQQRVAIARALVKNPQVLLADEPTGNLDEETRDQIMEILEELWRNKGLTLIMVTHDSNVAKRAKRNLNIANGRLSAR